MSVRTCECGNLFENEIEDPEGAGGETKIVSCPVCVLRKELKDVLKKDDPESESL